MSNNIKRDEPELAGGLFLSALKGLVVGIIIVVLLALILSAIALRTENPSGIVSVFAIITLCIGAVSVGFAAAKWCPANALLSGIVGGAAYIMLIWLLSLFQRGGGGRISALVHRSRIRGELSLLTGRRAGSEAEASVCRRGSKQSGGKGSTTATAPLMMASVYINSV